MAVNSRFHDVQEATAQSDKAIHANLAKLVSD